MENKLTLSEYRLLQDLVNQKFSFYSKLSDSDNRTKKMTELLTVAQKIDFVCHEIMASEVKING
ncbi:hypothetical protein [Jeotgalibaca porci]|uniref:hypothetical protein n=1 Tax=Jeotgalibaca porci TaxID=1868793 RepID=UPI00359F283B